MRVAKVGSLLSPQGPLVVCIPWHWPVFAIGHVFLCCSSEIIYFINLFHQRKLVNFSESALKMRVMYVVLTE